MTESYKKLDYEKLPTKVKRLLDVMVVVLVLGLLPVGYSLYSALTSPSSLPVPIKAVEWVRSSSGGLIVFYAEESWYTLIAPSKGGTPPPGAIPHLHPYTPKASLIAKGQEPAPIKPIISPTLPYEARWSSLGSKIKGQYPMYRAYMRSSKNYSQEVAGVVWMNKNVTSLHLAAGYSEPGGKGWYPHSPLPSSITKTTIAQFNSGFRLSAANGGIYMDHRLGRGPLKPGAASLVLYKNGTANIGTWGKQLNMTPQVQSVRQNLTLIVNNSKVIPGLRKSSFLHWGATVGLQTRVWRSGVGITKQGDLVYAAGNNISTYDLANVLEHAGAVRAMQMDINSTWVNFFYFTPPATPSSGHKLLPSMVRPTFRYFVPSARDFIYLQKR